MRNFISFIFIMSTLISCAQEDNIENKIRVQGYLFTITTLDRPIDINADTISIPIDKPKRYFFIPLNNMLPTFKETLEKINNFKSNSLYLPLTLTDSKENIEFTNFSLRKFLKDDTVNITQIDEYKNFQTNQKTIIQTIENKGTRWVYEIVYIDGLWEKLKVPFKWSEVISIGNYSSSSLNRKNKNGYDYYFLKEIKLIAYDLKLNESGLVKLNNFIKNDLIHETTHN